MAAKKRKKEQSTNAAIDVAIEAFDDFSLKKPGQGRLDRRVKIILGMVAAIAAVALVGLVMPQGIFDELGHSGGYRNGYTLAWFVDDLSENLSGLFALLVGDNQESVRTLMQIMTYAVIVLCGAGLALCGTVYQSTFRNALVSPSTLGVMSGAGLGMSLWVLLFYNPDQSHGLWFETGEATVPVDPLESLWNSYGLALCSFVGCLVVVGVVVLVIGTVGKGSTSGIMMIITGSVIGSVMGSISSAITYYFITVDPTGPQTEMMRELQISSFYRTYSLLDLAAVGVPVLIMFLLVMRYRSQLTLLAFSEEEARAMGVETRRMRFVVIGLATLVTAVIVSFCGRVGFVGFMMPLLARRLVGSNLTYLVPIAMVAGGLFVLAAYVLVCIFLGGTYATMSGVFISIGGTVVFLITAIRGKGGKRGAF